MKPGHIVKVSKRIQKHGPWERYIVHGFAADGSVLMTGISDCGEYYAHPEQLIIVGDVVMDQVSVSEQF